jgi:IS5 family transposase
MEEALYEIVSMCQFAGVQLSQSIPDETTILNFHHLLEQQGLALKLFETVNAHLVARGLMMRQSTMVDATIINAPSSTKLQVMFTLATCGWCGSDCWNRRRKCVYRQAKWAKRWS